MKGHSHDNCQRHHTAGTDDTDDATYADQVDATCNCAAYNAGTNGGAEANDANHTERNNEAAIRPSGAPCARSAPVS